MYMDREGRNEERDRINGLIDDQRAIRFSSSSDFQSFTSDIRAHNNRINHIRETVIILRNIAAGNMHNINSTIEIIITRLDTGLIRSFASNDSMPVVISLRENRERDAETDRYLQNARWAMDSEIAALEAKIENLESSAAAAQGRIDAADAEIRRLTNLRNNITAQTR